MGTYLSTQNREPTVIGDLSVAVEVGHVEDAEELVVSQHLTQPHHERVEVARGNHAVTVMVDEPKVNKNRCVCVFRSFRDPSAPKASLCVDPEYVSVILDK